MTFIAFCCPRFGEVLNSSTKWLSNIGPLVLFILGIYFNHEIRLWARKKSIEAVRGIHGNFLICSHKLQSYVNNMEQGACYMEAVEEYKKECLNCISHLSVEDGKALQNHLQEMKKLADRLNGAARKLMTKNDCMPPEVKLKAQKDQQRIKQDLENLENSLYQILKKYDVVGNI